VGPADAQRTARRCFVAATTQTLDWLELRASLSPRLIGRWAAGLLHRPGIQADPGHPGFAELLLLPCCSGAALSILKRQAFALELLLSNFLELRRGAPTLGPVQAAFLDQPGRSLPAASDQDQPPKQVDGGKRRPLAEELTGRPLFTPLVWQRRLGTLLGQGIFHFRGPRFRSTRIGRCPVGAFPPGPPRALCRALLKGGGGIAGVRGRISSRLAGSSGTA